MEVEALQYQLLPDLTSEEYHALKIDIEERGILVPVELDENGTILDGHHRLRAWHELKAEGKEVGEYARIIRAGMTEQQKRNHVRTLNLLRRHLTREQLQAQMVEMRKDGATLPEIAKATGQSVGSVHAATAEQLFNSEKLMGKDGKARPAHYRPRRLSASPPVSIFAATEDQEKMAQRAAPSLDQTEGTVTAKEAQKRMLENRRAEVAGGVGEVPSPSGKYKVIYADPPWQYGDRGVIGTDNYGRAERHYPTMSIEELCALPVADLADDNAVLFLWVTSPILRECFPVIQAWGFEYKASFIWDKVRHNFGHYNSVRHELLLICTRGSCLPESKELHDSVVEIERTDTHSEKPPYFRTLIESLYPSASRIELFARNTPSTPAWEIWPKES